MPRQHAVVGLHFLYKPVLGGRVKLHIIRYTLLIPRRVTRRFVLISSLLLSSALAPWCVIAEEPVGLDQPSAPSLPMASYFNALPPAQLPRIELPSGYLARIELNSSKELGHALQRAEILFREGTALRVSEPLAFVLHGPEVAIFFRENYEEYKSIVDLAARLSALDVIDVRVCRTRMGVLGRSPTVLLPFVGTVPFGPAEVERLVDDKKFVYF